MEVWIPAKSRRRTASFEFRLILGRVDPKVVDVCLCEPHEFQAHQSDVVHEEQVPGYELCQSRQMAVRVSMQYHANLNALLQALEIKDATYRLVIGAVGLDNVVMLGGNIRVNGDSDHEVGMVDVRPRLRKGRI